MKEPAITVYMPVYNTAPYLKESINSILTQSFTDFEFIIIDDSSTDNSLEIIRSFSDSRIRIIENKINLGVRKAANIGIRNAKGKYVVRMDSDDISVPERLQKQWNFMESHPEIGISGGNVELFGYEKGVRKMYLKHDEIKAGLLWSNTIIQGASIARKNIFFDDFFYDENGCILGEERELLYKMKDVVNFGNIDEILLYYRREHQGITFKLKQLSFNVNQAMHKKIFSDMAIVASDYELLLHSKRNPKILFSEKKNIKEYRLWLNKIINENNNFFSPKALEKLTEKHWKEIFYYLPDTGLKNVLNYWEISRAIHFDHFMYYSKWVFNKIVGRKKEKVGVA